MNWGFKGHRSQYFAFHFIICPHPCLHIEFLQRGLSERYVAKEDQQDQQEDQRRLDAEHWMCYTVTFSILEAGRAVAAGSWVDAGHLVWDWLVLLASLLQFWNSCCDWSDRFCSDRRYYNSVPHLLVLLSVQSMSKTAACCDHHGHHNSGSHAISTGTGSAAQLPCSSVPGLPARGHPAAAGDASRALPCAVSSPISHAATRTPSLPWNRGSWCWSTVPHQPAPVQPCLHGSSEAHLLNGSATAHRAAAVCYPGRQQSFV